VPGPLEQAPPFSPSLFLFVTADSDRGTFSRDFFFLCRLYAPTKRAFDPSLLFLPPLRSTPGLFDFESCRSAGFHKGPVFFDGLPSGAGLFFFPGDTRTTRYGPFFFLMFSIQDNARSRPSPATSVGLFSIWTRLSFPPLVVVSSAFLSLFLGRNGPRNSRPACKPSSNVVCSVISSFQPSSH